MLIIKDTATYQKGAKEDEWDKVWNGNVKTAGVWWIVWFYIALLAAHAWQHYLLPSLTCGTSTEQRWQQKQTEL